NQLFTMHGATMLLWYAAPVLSGFGNYLVPLLIGSRDMSFPRLNAFSYWAYLLSGILLYASVFIGQSPDTGWFSYVPLSNRRFDPAYNLDFYPLALILFTISNTAGAINFVTTIFKHRAPGMSISRMPLFLYSTGTTAFLSILAMPALAVGCVFLELDRQWNFHFFDVRAGGDAVLWQHLFWFIATFVIGGLSGVVTAVIPFDWQVHDTYFVVAHLHYVLIGANVFPVFAGFYYWLPKITGRMLDERLGKWSFWAMFAGFNVGFFPMHMSGLLGMRRRMYTFEAADGITGLNAVTTA